MDADNELLEFQKETWIDMTIFGDDNKPSVDMGSGLIYDLDDATDVGSMDTTAYMQSRKKENGKNAMGLAAMLAESSMKSAAGTSDVEDTSADEAASVEGDGTEDDEGMETNDDAQNTIPPTLNLSHFSDTDVAGNAGSETAADGSPPTATSAQPPPAKAVVEAQE